MTPQIRAEALCMTGMTEQPTPAGLLPLHEWQALMADPGGPAYRALATIYENHAAILDEKAALCLKALERFGECFGRDRDVFIVRSTGRVNLVGMHVDHRGGYVNPIAIREAFS